MTPAPSDRPEPSGPAPADERHLVVRAWAIRDTGLAPAPPRHRRLPGALRHHRGEGPTWPAEVELRVAGGHLEVEDVGRWPLDEIDATVDPGGPARRLLARRARRPPAPRRPP